MIDLYQEQAEAWATFDENDACKTCGAQVSEFNQVTHYRWHQELALFFPTIQNPSTFSGGETATL